MWAGAGEDPPCDTCYPGVNRWNEAAVCIYDGCANQYVTTPGGVAGISLVAANAVMDWYYVPVEDRPDIWSKVQVIVDALIKECQDEAERKALENKRKQ